MAHWIIEDKGFGGVVYRCSNCRESWNDYYSKFPKDYCRCCGEDIDEDANEYIEELKKTGIIGKWGGINMAKILVANCISYDDMLATSRIIKCEYDCQVGDIIDGCFICCGRNPISNTLKKR